jgi:hypothetical protein
MYKNGSLWRKEGEGRQAEWCFWWWWWWLVWVFGLREEEVKAALSEIK